MKKELLDDVDISILKILSEKSNTSYREIKEDLNISIGTIHNRINKLKAEKGGPIEGYTLMLDNAKLGYELTFLIRIQIDGKYTSQILKEICERPEVCSAFHTTGDQSAALICRFKESEDVHNFIRELNEKQHISRTISNMVLKTYKNSSFVQIELKKEQAEEEEE
jgi:Lrp/AsnC family transcriptional regulator for asnA, asnC and gidA